MAGSIEYKYQIGAEIKTVTVEAQGDRFRVTVGDTVYDVAAERPEHGKINLEVAGRRVQAHVAHSGPRRYVALAGETWLLERPSPTTRKRGLGGGSGQGGLEATMPGLVLDILVTAGEEVERGQTLLLLEAMKMELRISAPYAGRIARLCCAAGQVVERGQLLVEMEELC